MSGPRLLPNLVLDLITDFILELVKGSMLNHTIFYIKLKSIVLEPFTKSIMK